MAPEQVRGLPVDHRADLFALGAILYELLSGRRAFSRDTAPETMTAILNEDPPDLGAAAAADPTRPREDRQSLPGEAAVGAISDRQRSRLRAAGPLGRVGRLQRGVRQSTSGPQSVDWLGRRRVAAGDPGAARVSARPRAPSGARLDSLPGGADRRIRGTGEFQRLSRWPSPRVRGSRFGRDRPALDPDHGFTGSSAAARFRAHRRHASSFLVSGRTVRGVRCRRQAQEAGRVGRPAANLVRSAERQRRRGRIVESRRRHHLRELRRPVARPRERRRRVSTHIARRVAERGIPSAADLSPGRPALRLPARVAWSAGGQRHLHRHARREARGTKPGAADAVRDRSDVRRGHQFRRPGRLLFLREGTLIAQPFDERRLALAGEPVPVAERVGSFRDGAFFSVSANDVLVYRTADTDSQLTWFDRQGVVSGRVSEPGGFRDVALSPDGTRAVAARTNPQDTTKADLWLFDLKRGSGATRLTLGGGIAEFPVWSPDGTRIVFTFNNSILRQKLASGEGDEEELLRSNSASALWANSWSPDGRFLLYAESVATGLRTRERRSRSASRPTSESRCRSYATRVDSTRSRPGFRQWGDGSPTSRISQACRKCTSASLRPTSAADQPAREKVCWCPAAAAAHHAGVVMAASSFISRRAGN